MLLDPPFGILGWLLVGLIAGALATTITNSRAGCWTNLLLGIIGSCVGGYFFRLFGFHGQVESLIGGIVVAFIGAVIVIGFGRLIPK